MQIYDALYRNARLYAIAFQREVEPEVDFLIEAARRFSGKGPESVLDVACGPSYHALAVARKGLRSVGLDLCAPMLQHAQERAERDGLTVEWVEGDMRAFQLEQPVDVAVCAIDSLSCLLTNEDIIRNLRAVAANLTPRGLYVLEMTHPTASTLGEYGAFTYSGTEGGTHVEVDWAVNHPKCDLSRQVWNVGIRIRVTENGTTEEFSDEGWERHTHPQELAALVELSGYFDVAAVLGDWSLEQPLDHSEGARRFLVVLQKREVPKGAERLSYLSPKAEARTYPEKGGGGLFAREAIPAGELVCLWAGRVLTGAQLDTVPEEQRPHTVQIEEDLYLAPAGSPEPTDYVNHSCDPTCGMSGQCGVITRRAVAAGEELCVDYAMCDGSPYDEFQCACGTPLCRGKVSGNDWQLPELQEKYRGYFSPYLQRRIDAARG